MFFRRISLMNTHLIHLMTPAMWPWMFARINYNFAMDYLRRPDYYHGDIK